VVRGLLNLEAEKHSYSFGSTHLRLTRRHFPRQIQNEDSSKILQRYCKLCKMKK